MAPKPDKPKIFLYYIFPILTTILGCAIGYYLSPKDNSNQIIELQHKQIDTLSNGFDKLIIAVKNSSISDTVIVNNINSVKSQLNTLIESSNEIYKKYFGDQMYIDTIAPLKISGKTDSLANPQPTSLAIETKIGTTRLIDNSNYFAITNEYENGDIAITINGGSTSMRHGSKRTLVSPNGGKFDFVYDRKVNDVFVFLIVKNK